MVNVPSSVELDGGLECDDLLDSGGGLRLGLQGREGGFDGVEVGYVGLVVFLVVQLHDIFDDMRFEGLSITITKTRVIINEIMLYYISPRRCNAEENGHDDNYDDDDDNRDLDVRLTS